VTKSRDQINIRVDAEQLAKWRARAESEGGTLPALIERALDRYLRTNADKASDERRMAAIGRRVVKLVESVTEDD